MAVKLQRIAAIGLLLAACLFVFFDQASDPGFAKGHRGWVSAHVLAVISHASAEHGFVGYALEFQTKEGRPHYYYFDRYPVLFSAVMHAVLYAGPLSKAQQIDLARQLMNGVYVLTLLAATALLIELQVPVGLAVAAVALAGAGHHMVAFRDMVHFDQPAILGCVLLLWAIARWYRTGRERLLYVLTALAVMLGRGYASFAVLGLFWLIEAFRTLRVRRAGALKTIALGAPTRACLLSIAVAGTCLAYNITTEARIRQVPLSEVSIVKSAKRRLLIDDQLVHQRGKYLAWGRFSGDQAQRAFKGLQPYGFGYHRMRNTSIYLTLGFVAALVAVWIARRRPELRAPLILMALSGIAWLFPMRGLAAFHEYTSMYLFSMNLVVFTMLLSLCPVRFQLVPAALAVALLVHSTHERNLELQDRSYPAAFTADLEHIEEALEPGEAVRVKPSPRKLIRGVPYALGFYLPDHPLLPRIRSRAVISKNPHHKGKNITPHNRYIFLYRGAKPM